MKKNLLIVLGIFTILMIHSCIIQAGFKKKGDGSTALSHEDSLQIKKYEGQNPSDMQHGYFTVTAIDVKKILQMHQYTWMIVQASWCPHSLSEFPGKVSLIDSISKTKDLLLFPVFQDYNLALTNRIVNEAKYEGPVFILESGYFGSNESMKHEKLLSEVFHLYQPIPSVPHHLIVNRNLDILFEKIGELHNADSAITVFH